MSANWEKAKQAARDIRSKFSSDGLSVNAFEVAKANGINVLYFKPEPGDEIIDASGVLDK